MNRFQERVLKKYPEIEFDDFIYFTGEAENKVAKMGLPKMGCKITTFFVGGKHGLYYQREYCLKNCGLKCLDNLTEKIKK